MQCQTKFLGLFLVLVLLVQFGYPITYSGRAWLFIYQLFYALMFVSGLLIIRESAWQFKLNIGSAMAFLGFAIWYLLEPMNPWANLATYAALIPFQITVIAALVRFVQLQEKVTLTTILAAVTIYLLIGAIFVPFYGLIETLAPGSFVDSAFPGEGVVWQQLVYYSYVTLNTVGYGDILPHNPWARSLSTLEAATGILYVALAIARLVSLYDRNPQS